MRQADAMRAQILTSRQKAIANHQRAMANHQKLVMAHHENTARHAIRQQVTTQPAALKLEHRSGYTCVEDRDMRANCIRDGVVACPFREVGSLAECQQICDNYPGECATIVHNRYGECYLRVASDRVGVADQRRHSTTSCWRVAGDQHKSDGSARLAAVTRESPTQAMAHRQNARNWGVLNAQAVAQRKSNLDAATLRTSAAQRKSALDPATQRSLAMSAAAQAMKATGDNRQVGERAYADTMKELTKQLRNRRTDQSMIRRKKQ